MIDVKLFGIPLSGFCLIGAVLSSAHAEAGARSSKISYAKSIAPIMRAKCVACHNPQRHPEKVDVSSFEATMKSGEHGSIVSAHHPEKSNLLLYVNGVKSPRMPFKSKPLSPSEISLIKAWIQSGANR